MKLTIGYISAFLAMTVFVAVILFAIFATIPIAIMFITLAPLNASIDWFMILRVCIVIGAIIGSLFVFSDEGRGFAEEVKDLLDGR